MFSFLHALEWTNNCNEIHGGNLNFGSYMIVYACWIPWLQSLGQIMHNYRWPVLLFICKCMNFQNHGNEYLAIGSSMKNLKCGLFSCFISNEYISPALIKLAFSLSDYWMSCSKGKDQELCLVNKNFKKLQQVLLAWCSSFIGRQFRNTLMKARMWILYI